MSWIVWRPEYKVGDPMIDQDHQNLFKLINEFHDTFHRHKTRQELLQVLNNLVAYAEEHFQREEFTMAAHGYPQLEEHQQLHEQLYDRIYALNELLLDDQRPAEDETIAFLKNWLTDHILQHDFAFAAFVRKNK